MKLEWTHGPTRDSCYMLRRLVRIASADDDSITVGLRLSR
jgi:hypothetical protein